MAVEPNSGFLALRDRAYAFLASHAPVTEEALLEHVYGGTPPAPLQGQLTRPLLADRRLERRHDGSWALVGRQPQPRGQNLAELAFTSLALVATGPRPNRGRMVQFSALHVHNGTIVERFSASVNPGKRVPRYVADRLGLATEELDDLPTFGSLLDELQRFLDTRPVIAQDARLTWAFLEAEAHRAGQALADRLLIDANELATHLLELKSKPTLGLVAARLGIGTVRIPRPDEEARVLGLVATRLLALAAEHDSVGPGLEATLEARATNARAALRSDTTVAALAEVPGVYVLRDLDQTPLYVGKARRLRSRMAAYVNRPLGATRRLEGLVGAVDSVDSVVCATDLEALILEDREIRRLQPRFNTVRQQRTPRVWIRLPPTSEPRPGKRRQLAPARLELSRGPAHQPGGDGAFVGPFRNESLAAQARLLARQVFALDALRGARSADYTSRLHLAWQFLNGQTEVAVEYARRGPASLMRQLLGFDVQASLLPADPQLARYAVLRPGESGVEGFVVDRGILVGWVPPQIDDHPSQLAAALLGHASPRTDPEDVAVVLRWFGAQRPPARLVHLPDDPLAATEAIEDAASGLRDWPG